MAKALLKTGVDELVRLIKEKNKITVSDAAKGLGVSQDAIDEWADFLEEDNVIDIEYKFANTWLINKKLQKGEIKEKIKNVEAERSIIIRKSESLLNLLDNEGGDITKIKKEFNKIKDEIHSEANSVHDELEELEKYDELKNKVERNIKNQDKDFKNKITEIGEQTSRMQKKYSDLLKKIGIEEKEIKKQKLKGKSIQKTEDKLKNNIKNMHDSIKKLKKELGKENEYLKSSDDHLNHLKELAKKTKETTTLQKRKIPPLIKKNKEYQMKIKKSQEDIVKKVFKKSMLIKNNINESKKLSTKFKKFFEKKMEAVDLIDKINEDKDNLRKELTNFIKKAKAFKVLTKTKDIQKEINVMEKKFKDIDNKKNVFEKEITKISSLLKKKK